MEVSSPNADSENMLCSNSILTASMCSKVVPSCSTDPNNTPVAACNRIDAVINVIHKGSPTNETKDSFDRAKIVAVNVNDSNTKKRDDLTSLGSDDSGKRTYVYIFNYTYTLRRHNFWLVNLNQHPHLDSSWRYLHGG